jgi:hypothetical protein
VQTGHSAWWTDEALARDGDRWLRATAALTRSLLPCEMADVAS